MSMWLWWEQLTAAGFDKGKRAIVVSTGVSMYLTKEANMATLQKIAKLAVPSQPSDVSIGVTNPS